MAPVGDSDGSRSPGPTLASRSGASAGEEDEVAQMQRLPITETELRLVQRDMIRVLDLPAAENPLQAKASFKRRTGPAEGKEKIFPTLRLDQVCIDRMQTIMAGDKWRPYAPRERDYYQFPAGDFENFLSTPASGPSRIKCGTHSRKP